MKGILIAIVFTFFFTGFNNAQGNLQFNQVILEQFNAVVTGLSQSTATTLTVPVGKVWKIEHANLYVGGGAYPVTLYGGYSLFIDSVLIYRHKGDSGTQNSFSDRFPLWLPEGTYNINIGNERNNSYDFYVSINALEFNVVP